MPNRKRNRRFANRSPFLALLHQGGFQGTLNDPLPIDQCASGTEADIIALKQNRFHLLDFDQHKCIAAHG